MPKPSSFPCRVLSEASVSYDYGREDGQRNSRRIHFPTRRKPKGATIGTSIASRVARRHLDFKIEKDILPTLTLGSVRRLTILWTRNIGVFVGRTVPIIGEVILAYDVSVISYRSAVHYNQLVKPEDRL